MSERMTINEILRHGTKATCPQCRGDAIVQSKNKAIGYCADCMRNVVIVRVPRAAPSVESAK